MLKVIFKMVVLVVLIVGMSGCDSEIKRLGKVILEENGQEQRVFGYTSTVGQYRGAGAKLYNKDWKLVGYITADGEVIEGEISKFSKDSKDFIICGSVYNGVCEGGRYEDGILYGVCVLKSVKEESLGYSARCVTLKEGV